MKRVLIFISGLILAILAILLLAGIPNFTAFKTLFSNSDGMAEGSEFIESTYSLQGLTEFIGEHPEWVSVASFNVNNPDSGIYYQENVPRSMGSIANFFLLLEYERQVAEGLINPNEIITYEHISLYFLPQISENNHNEAMKKLKEINPDQVSLDNVVSVMVSNNDLALADLVWFELGEENIRTLISSLGLEESSLPLPYSGLYTAIHPQLNDTSITLIPSKVIEMAEKFRSDLDYNEEVKELFRLKFFGEHRLQLSFMEERDALRYFPQITALQITNILSDLYQKKLVSEVVSTKVKEKMSWAIKSENIQRRFTEYGAFYDNRMGLLNGIDFGTSIYNNQTSVQSVFFDRLPVGFWLHMSSNHMQEDFQQRLIWDPALYKETLEEVSETTTSSN